MLAANGPTHDLIEHGRELPGSVDRLTGLALREINSPSNMGWQRYSVGLKKRSAGINPEKLANADIIRSIQVCSASSSGDILRRNVLEDFPSPNTSQYAWKS